MTGAPLTGKLLRAHRRLRRSIGEIRDDRGPEAQASHHRRRPADAIFRRTTRPAPITPGTGRSKGSEPVALHRGDQRAASRCVQCLPGFDTRFIPLHYYLIQAMDLMYAHLKSGRRLPLSQVVHTEPRGGTPGSAPPISAANNLPPIGPAPADADRITFIADVLTIPE